LKDARSRELFERAKRVMPGGVSSPVRALKAVGRDPLFIASASGAELLDVDGNRFIDYVCSWGPLILGHAHPEVVEAIARAAKRGSSYGAPSEVELELAEEVASRVPSVEMVRFTSSGTEAVMTALRLARSVTARDKVVKFEGAYHGHVDGLLAEAGSGLATHGIAASPGVTAAQAKDTIVVRWNDSEQLDSALAAAAGELAAVLVEPVPANMGVVPAREGFLQLLVERSREAGALLILDEVITGFRTAMGGAQERYGIRGDLTVLGKVLGGGLPLAAVAGPGELMERLAPAGETYQAGTLSGSPIATAAGLATLALLTDAEYGRLETITSRLVDGLREASAGAGVQVACTCGLFSIFFSDRPVTSYDEANAADKEAYARFWGALLEAGVYAPPSPFEAWFPSLAHGDEEIDRTLEAATEAFKEVRA
jgi:glutamate-1-semialdehyde 2,1-aminomutase